MNRTFIRFCTCASALCAAFALTAQDESADGAAKAETSIDGIDPALVKAATAKPSAKYFHSLVRFTRAAGSVMVKLPRQSEFAPAIEGKFYPNGSVFRVSGGATDQAEFEFGKGSVIKVTGNAEFGTRETEFGSQPRTVTPVSGSFAVSLPRTLPTGMFTVAYPNFTVSDMAGESRHELTPSGDGDEAVVHVVTGMLSVEGPHYKIPRMSAANRIRIRTTGESLFTSLRGEAGDYKVSLDQGCSQYRDPVTGEVKRQDRRLDFSLTPQCAIKIFRKRSSVGGRMAVSVMTFDASGDMRNRYTFAEGTASVNFGEEVVRIQDISFKTKKDADGKKEEDKKDKPEEGGSESNAGDNASSSGESSGGDNGFGF